MPSLKIYPPSQLPDRDVTETQFNIWQEELEVYLMQEKDYAVFLKDGAYDTWESLESNKNRIAALKAEDIIEADAANNRSEAQAQAANEEFLKNVRKNLRTTLSIIGKCVSQGHYNSVIRHSTSLEWIMNMLRSDYDIQQKGIHFFNILDVKYVANSTTPVAFYNQYRTVISNNLAKAGDVIKYKGSEELAQDEKMSPMLEDLILLNVIAEIDQRLPTLVKTHYNHKMKKEERLMDFKADILVNIPAFLEQLDISENNSIKEEPSLNAFKQTTFNARRNKKISQAKSAQPQLFCRVCMLAKLPREIFTSHNPGDNKCTSLSVTDKKRLTEALLTTIKEDTEVDDDEIAELYGYTSNINEEVNSNSNQSDTKIEFSRNETVKCGYIKPVPSQILTVFQDVPNKSPIHIELDSGATVSYCLESEAHKRGFKIFPNGQLSKLGDGLTKLKGIGEIHVTFFRNSWSVSYNAIVCKELTSPFIGGTLFLKENGIEQDFIRNVIKVHDGRIKVQPTDQISLLTTAPVVTNNSKVTSETCKKVSTLPFKSSILLPGQEVSLNLNKEDGTEICVEPGVHNKTGWPEPQFQTVNNGKIFLRNSTIEPIYLGKDVKNCQIRDTEYAQEENLNYYTYKMSSVVAQSDDVSQIDLKGINDEEALETIRKTHETFKEVFNNDLTNGYNGSFGKHECKLNWATEERPLANKVNVPSYDHGLKVLQQELMDDLTDQGVLLIPQEHDINVQTICPSFIQRKQRAREKPKNQLTKQDVRLLINFGPVNDKIKPVPIHVPTTEDILTSLGRWKHIIIFDLYNGYFQNHMSKDAMPWLGVQTPFGGMRVMSRSGQGLGGMAEEFDELMAKILKNELKDGICAKIVDDLYVGGANQREAAENYFRIVGQLHKANIKITPEKTFIFPKQADVLGWVWKEGGYLQVSPHRKIALINTTINDIKNVQDMRSWVGLFKTLHIATPHISNILAPFEKAVAGRDSKDSIEWDFELEKRFRKAKESLNDLATLYLPSPHDQLLLETDAAKGGGKHNLPAGIGHVLYAIKDGKKIPVRFHSAKLPDKCKKWSPCEVEALALAAGVNKEYDIIRESKLPLIIQPDSKPVHEAIKLINNGKFSASARMSSFLTNVNRTNIETRHISGKAKLNPLSDVQSRSPPKCNSEFCSIHKFIDESVHNVIDEGAKNCSINASTQGFTNKQSWKSAQQSNQACVVAKQFLSSGKPPPKAMGKTAGEYWNDIRQYCRDASISKDGLLVVKTNPNNLSGNIARERIVVPKPLVPALLYHLHNHNDDHQARSQQKAVFQRQFYAISLDKHLDLLYKNCYKCSIIQKLPKEVIVNETKTLVEGPHTHFHADVIKRAQQNILTVRDHFSSFQEAIIIESESSGDLKEGLIMLTSGIRRPSDIFISVDNSPGFKSLLLHEDPDLTRLKIKIVKTDEINKNSNAVIDKGCQELEAEIKQLEPEGKKLTNSTLKQAVLNLNSKLRRKGNISAFEINSSRDQNTGVNLHLDDQTLRQNQINKRGEMQKGELVVKPIEVGDTVKVKNASDKHKANDIFIVTSKEDEHIGIQKLLHPLKKNPPKFMGKVYKTNQKYLHTIHRPSIPFKDPSINIDGTANNTSKDSYNTVCDLSAKWNPIRKQFFQDDSDDDEDDSNSKNNIETRSNLVSQQRQNPVLDSSHTSSELQWDDSPEQYQLEEEASDADLNEVLQPRVLFPPVGEDDQENDSITSEDASDDDVFHDEHKTPSSQPKLTRSNAMRYRQRPEFQTVPRSDPRVTRQMLSNPTSPYNVNLHERQNLNEVLNPNVPLLPELVNLGPMVQNFENALENPQPLEVRKSGRRKKQIDYLKFHEEGKKE